MIGGKTLKETEKYTLKSITIKQLQSLENSVFWIPDFQRNLNDEKVNSMKETDLDWFTFCTNSILFAYLKTVSETNIYYLIDGQHRYQAFKTKPNTIINITIINCDSIDEILKLYNTINYDNTTIIKFDDVEKYVQDRKYLVFKKELKNEMNDYFKNLRYIYGLEEFIIHLQYNKYLDNFDNISDAIDNLKAKNNEFYELYYENKDISKYKKKEQEYINKIHVLALRNNNFKDFLINYNESFSFIHIH
jgi:hypothetical protein